MQRETERRTTGEAFEPDELAERRQREPRFPRGVRPRVVEYAAQDQRYRAPAAANLGEQQAAIVELLAANPRAMESMLAAAWQVAERRADDKPWADLAKAISKCRERVAVSADDDAIAAFDAWAARAGEMRRVRMWPPLPDDLSLTRDQHFVLLACSFASNKAIAEHMRIDLDALRTRQKRLRELGVLTDTMMEPNLVSVVEVVLGQAGVDLAGIFERFDNADDVEDTYECTVLELMHARLVGP